MLSPLEEKKMKRQRTNQMKPAAYSRKKELSEQIVQLRVTYLCSAFSKSIAEKLAALENEFNTLCSDKNNYMEEKNEHTI